MSDFDKAFEIFISGCQSIVEDNNKQFNHVECPVIEFSKGRKYMKVIRNDHSQKSVHCFIDMTNGNVLKAASWKSPAKHARGNIYNDDHGLGCMGPYGAAYLNK